MQQKRSISKTSLKSARAADLRYVTGEGPGIVRKRRGRSFYYLSENQKPLRNAAILKRIRSLVIPPAWQSVWICPFENGHIQAVGRDARGRKQYRYHARYRSVRDETKFERMLAFGAALPAIRRRVTKDLALPGLPKQKVVALIVRLLDKTAIRIGNEEYAKTNKSFGLTTLRNRHAEVHGENLHLHFLGKSHQEHDVQLHDRRVAAAVKRCQDLPGQELFQWKSATGEHTKVDSADVNEYLREITKQDFSAKDFRTWHGTGHMVRELVGFGRCETETESKRNIVQAIKETAKHLGNRPAACRKYYVHPAVFESYTKGTIFAVMQVAGESTTHLGDIKSFELRMARLIKSHTSKRKPKQ